MKKENVTVVEVPAWALELVERAGYVEKFGAEQIISVACEFAEVFKGDFGRAAMFTDAVTTILRALEQSVPGSQSQGD